jgi:hypothetical protein
VGRGASLAHLCDLFLCTISDPLLFVILILLNMHFFHCQGLNVLLQIHMLKLHCQLKYGGRILEVIES